MANNHSSSTSSEVKQHIRDLLLLAASTGDFFNFQRGFVKLLGLQHVTALFLQDLINHSSMERTITEDDGYFLCTTEYLAESLDWASATQYRQLIKLQEKKYLKFVNRGEDNARWVWIDIEKIMKELLEAKRTKKGQAKGVDQIDLSAQINLIVGDRSKRSTKKEESYELRMNEREEEPSAARATPSSASAPPSPPKPNKKSKEAIGILSEAKQDIFATNKVEISEEVKQLSKDLYHVLKNDLCFYLSKINEKQELNLWLAPLEELISATGYKTVAKYLKAYQRLWDNKYLKKGNKRLPKIKNGAEFVKHFDWIATGCDGIDADADDDTGEGNFYPSDYLSEDEMW